MNKWIIDKLKLIKSDLMKLHKSITIWFNGILAAISFALPEIVSFIPQLHDYIPDDNYKTLMLIALVGNFIIRFHTTSALRNK